MYTSRAHTHTHPLFYLSIHRSLSTCTTRSPLHESIAHPSTPTHISDAPGCVAKRFTKVRLERNRHGDAIIKRITKAFGWEGASASACSTARASVRRRRGAFRGPLGAVHFLDTRDASVVHVRKAFVPERTDKVGGARRRRGALAALGLAAAAAAFISPELAEFVLAVVSLLLQRRWLR